MNNPVNQDNYPVLYSFRRCPYAIRTRIALLLCGQRVELREVLLSDKPASMIEVSAKATVPVLCMANGTVIDESLDIIRWVLTESNDMARLFTEDTEQQLKLIARNDGEFKHWLDRYKYHVRFPQHSQEYYRQQGLQFLASLETRLAHSPFLFGARPQAADVAIMPFVRQFHGVDRDWFESNVSDAVRHWLHRWQDTGIFKQAMVKYPVWRSGQTPVIL